MPALNNLLTKAVEGVLDLLGHPVDSLGILICIIKPLQACRIRAQITRKNCTVARDIFVLLQEASN